MDGRGRGRGRGRGEDRGGRGGRGGWGGGDRGRGQGQGHHRGSHSHGAQFPGSDSGSASHQGQGSRPREGDWACSNCGFNNYERNRECYKCHASKSGGSEGSRQREGDWACSNCGFNNYERNRECYKCRASKSGGSEGGSRQEGGFRGRGRGGEGGGFQRGGRGRGGYQHGGDEGRGRGGAIDWAAEEKAETESVTSTKSDPEAEAAYVKKLNDLPPELAGEDKTKYSIIPDRINKGPVVGKRGRQIVIEVNHVKLTFDPKKTVAIHYDCAFSPDKLSKKLLRKIMIIMKDRHYSSRNPAFDGKKNLYSSGDTPLFRGKELNDTVELPPEEGKTKPLSVKVTIKEVEEGKENRVNLSLISRYMQRQISEYPQKAVQVMEIVLRSAPATAGFIQVGRSFFTAPERPISLGHGMELYHGFFQSVVLGWQTFLNVDVANKGFPEARVVSDVMSEFKNTRGGFKPHPSQMEFNKEELDNFRDFIKNIRIDYYIPNIVTSKRKFTVIGVKRPANQQSFLFKKNENDSGRHMTVEQYFAQEKGYKLQFPHLPCLHVGNPKRDICVPPELCKVVVGQVMMKKMDADQTTAMIRQCAIPPKDRKEKIMSGLFKTNHNRDKSVNEFGITVGQEFTKVNARILPTPTIDYGNRKTAQPANGQWNMQTFKEAKNMVNWAITSVASNAGPQDLSMVVNEFMKHSREVGMNIDEPSHSDCLVDRNMPDRKLFEVLVQTFRRYKEENVQLVVVIIPNKTAYGIVKSAAELNVGIVTSAIMQKTLRRFNQSTVKNLFLKFNTKLGGVNHTVIRNPQEVLSKPDRVIELLKGTMLMGADVTHPSPDQKHIPSVAAVTASHDPLQFRYNMVWQLQPPKQEILANLDKIVIKHLRYYKTGTGKYPERIIFYRDGVSEGQFIQVLQVEMTCIKAACRRELGQDLPVTFLVVQKRHHTRFFPTGRDHTDAKGNVPPGTVVDTQITHPTQADFYLASHASLQGTSRPTKYHKLWDDNDIDEDDLEELTFFLCHMFARCTRSVSYPAPTYYAHLAAARGKVYLEGSRVNIEELDKEMRARTVHSSIVDKAPMYFV